MHFLDPLADNGVLESGVLKKEKKPAIYKYH